MEIRALIVDDEKYERLLLSKLINWDKLGIQLAGTAASGDEALRIFQEIHPEIVLTDISMPEMDGLELSRCLKSADSEVDIVIITGFREFEYARQAISIGVEEFLLKPIDQVEVEKLLLKIKNEIIKKKSDREILNESIPLLAEDYVRKLLMGDTTQQTEEKLLQYWGDVKESNGIQVCIIKYTGNVLTQKGYQQSMQLFRRMFGDFHHTRIYENEAVIICPEQEESVYKEFERRMRTMSDGYSVMMAVSNVYGSLKEAGKAYQESRKVILGSLRNMRPVVFYRDYEKMEQNVEQLYSKNFDEYALAVRNGQFEDAVDFIDAWLGEYIKNDIAPVAQLRNVGVILLYNTEKGLNEWGKSISDIMGGDVYKNIVEIESLKEFCTRMNEILTKVTDYVTMLKSNTVSSTVQKCRRYILEHMDTPGLSLKHVADTLYLNESYLSRIFKQATGESVNRFLMRCRIEKSMELLNTTSLKAYEVGEKVGMPDAHYFGLAFKKYTGKTINEFRNLSRSQNHDI